MDHAKEKAERRAARVREAQARVQAIQEREAKLQKALKERTTGFDAREIERYLEKTQKRPNGDEGLRQFLLSAISRTPKFANPDTIQRLKKVWVLPMIRPYEEWKPEGKGRTALFDSFVDHALCKYRMPRFMYGVFHGNSHLTNRDQDNLLLFCHLAQGGSVMAAVKNGLLPVPLTKRMAHLFTQAPSDCDVVSAVRWAQVKALGGSGRLAEAVRGSFLGQDFLTTEDFWLTVIHWLCLNPMLEAERVAPILDFLRFKRGADPEFSMKGRSVLAVLRDTEAWHKELQKQRSGHGYVFKPSGFYGMRIEEASGRVWQIKEIESPEELRKEGQVMRHCIWSYAFSVAQGRISIWSLTATDKLGQLERCLSIEVVNAQARIVQARGYCNRMATPQERMILQQWCSRSSLSLGGYA